MKRLMHFLTKRQKVFSPANASPEVGIIGIEFKPIPVSQTVEHGIDHVIQLNEETTVNASMIDESAMERFVYPLIITYFHTPHVLLA